MKLFQHYKGKFYRYFGLVRHSETLEELVYYKTRYENDLGSLWVRPKEMFFSDIEINGKTQRRFRELKLEIETSTEVTDAHLAQMAEVILAMGFTDTTWFIPKLRNQKKLMLLLAKVEGKCVGYKLGYEEDPWTFYSWQGGVATEYQGVGIATDLMKTQHEWCKAQGYKKIQTKTQNRFREMLLLNIKTGFDIIGTHDFDQGGMKIVLEKKL